MRDQERSEELLGVIIGNRSATPLEFWFALLEGEGKVAVLDEVVLVRTNVPQYGEVKFYGVITDMERYLEDSKYAIDSKLYSEKKLPALASWIAKVTVTRIEPEDAFLPPAPGDKVFKASKEDVEKAFYFDAMGDNKVPAGLLPNGEVFYVNLEFLDGRKGAHVSITGISGVATKTSYATFLMYSIFNSKHAKLRNYKGMVFNVKGEDLLYMGYKNAKLLEDTDNKAEMEIRLRNREMWRKLGVDPLEAEGFKNVQIYAPPKSGTLFIDTPEPDVDTSLLRNVKVYGWNIFQFARERLFRFLFVDERNLPEGVSRLVNYITERLALSAERELERNPKPKTITLKSGYTLSDLKDLYDALESELDSKNRYLLPKDESTNTIRALLRRFEKLKDELNRLVNPKLTPPDFREGDLIVVDVHSLSSKAQSFVIASVLYNLYLEKIERGKTEPIVFVLIDELNKYAPSDGYTPFKDILVDIAERGRSLGLILIGAQQTASQVEPRILANSSLKVVGRMDPAEVQKPIYHYMSPVTRQRATILKPGRMIVSQPDCPVPVLIKFPMPIWATRRDEVKEDLSQDAINEMFL